MIRINLLPVKKTRKKEALQRQLILFGIGLVILLALLAVLFLQARSKLSNVRGQVAQVEADIEALRLEVGEVEVFLERKEELEQKLAVIDELRASKTGPVRMLDEIATRIPQRVWLTGLSEQSGRVSLEGSAVSNEVIADFMSNLEDSDYFRDVYLVSIQASNREDSRLKDFTVTATVVHPDPAEEAGDEGAEG